MKNKLGFTLIELLVVVLIIGILAAIVIPQYRITIIRARLANMREIVFQLKQAEEIYYLIHGNYSSHHKDLDLDTNCQEIKGTGVCDNYFRFDLINGSAYNIRYAYCPEYAKDENRYYYECQNKSDFYITEWLLNSDYPRQRGCYGNTNIGRKICKTLG